MSAYRRLHDRDIIVNKTVNDHFCPIVRDFDFPSDPFSGAAMISDD
jgi:hypothetical protein